MRKIYVRKTYDKKLDLLQKFAEKNTVEQKREKHHIHLNHDIVKEKN